MTTAIISLWLFVATLLALHMDPPDDRLGQVTGMLLALLWPVTVPYDGLITPSGTRCRFCKRPFRLYWFECIKVWPRMPDGADVELRGLIHSWLHPKCAHALELWLAEHMEHLRYTPPKSVRWGWWKPMTQEDAEALIALARQSPDAVAKPPADNPPPPVKLRKFVPERTNHDHP